MFETLKSGNKTSSGEISLSIRIHARSKVWPMKGVTVYGHPPECRVTHLKWRINDSKISCFNFNYMYLVCVTVRLKFLGRRVVMICDRSQTICSARKFIEVVIFKGVLYGSFLSSSIIEAWRTWQFFLIWLRTFLVGLLFDTVYRIFTLLRKIVEMLKNEILFFVFFYISLRISTNHIYFSQYCLANSQYTLGF